MYNILTKIYSAVLQNLKQQSTTKYHHALCVEITVKIVTDVSYKSLQSLTSFLQNTVSFSGAQVHMSTSLFYLYILN